MKFNPGDRVVFTPPPGSRKDSWNQHKQVPGDTGTVESSFDNEWGYRVKWDNGAHDPGWKKEWLEAGPPLIVMDDTRSYLAAVTEGVP